jgi:hypothetical protein
MPSDLKMITRRTRNAGALTLGERLWLWAGIEALCIVIRGAEFVDIWRARRGARPVVAVSKLASQHRNRRVGTESS